MSSRFPPSSGFNSRDRSPQRFGDRRPPAGPRGPDDGPAPFGRDPPRGPRALVDSPRGGHFGGGRGRGYGRGDFRDRDRDRDRDFRDNRDGHPFRRDLDRDWPRRGHDRDRDFDSRDNRIGFGRGRSRSPTRDFRDIREPPGRDFDLVRMRRNSRDSILSASSGGPDGPPPNMGHMPRGGMRGRGRGDWEGGRGRGGRPFLDDRDLFRRRSRSREPWRGRDRMMDRDRERDFDRERVLDRERMMDRDRDRDILRPRDRERDLLDRDLDRRDRFDRREDWDNNRRPDREDRDRPADSWKRDRPPSRTDSRAASGSTTSSHPPTAPGPALTSTDRLPEHQMVDHNRKPSIIPGAPTPESGRDTERNDHPTPRPELMRPNPVRPNPARPDTVQSDPSRPGPARADPIRPELTRPEPARSEPTRPEPTRPEPTRPEHTRPEHTRPEPARPEPARPEPARPEPARPDPARPETAQHDSVQSEPIRQEPRRESGAVGRRSPPPAAPQVPAFGSVAAPMSTQPVVKDPFERKTLKATSRSEQDGNNVTQRLPAQPPTGPKADRADTSHSFDPRNRHEGIRDTGHQQPPPPRSLKTSTNLPDVSPPTAPAAMTRPDPAANDQFPTGRSNSLTSSPTFTRIPPPAPRLPSREPSMSPRTQSSGIPTGPRALQWPASSPRSRKGSKQWVRPGYGRTPSIPNAPSKQESVDDGESAISPNEVGRPAPRAPSPFDMDEPESGEILPHEHTKGPSPVSPMHLPIRRSLSATLDGSGEIKEPIRKANDEGSVMIPDFERSSDEDDGENIVFTKEYLDERRQLFEKDMESLRAELPLSPLEDPTIVALLMKIQLLGMVANQDVAEQSGEGPTGPTNELPTEPPTEPLRNPSPERPAELPLEPKEDPVPSLREGDSKDNTATERAVSFVAPLLEREPEPLTKTTLPSRVSHDEVTVSGLPFLQSGPPTPISDMDVYQENIATQDRLGDTLTAELSKEQNARFRKNELLRDEYLSHYKPWRLAIWELDRMKDKTSITPAPVSPPVSTVPTTPAPMPEGREGRRYKGNSELDFLNALKASEISAQEELERRRTKMATARPDLGREAIIPNMLEPKEEQAGIYKDVNNIIECSRALDVFGFLPPPNDFTPEEHIVFTDAFMAHPKRWGKIAESLPGRTFQQCIVHYYLTKEEIKYKAKLNKRWSKRSKASRKGARPKSNALIADLGVVKPDFDGAEDTPAVTDTGRPRRAAAPTFGENVEPESTVSIGRRGQPVRDGEPVERAPARRGGRGGSGRGGRRVKPPQPDTKSQAILPQVNAPSVPPPPASLGTEMELTPDTIMEGYEARERQRTERESLQQIPRGRIGRGRAKDGVYVFESTEVEQTPISKQPETGYGSLQPTSYWSVPEQRDFPALLGHFGRDFEGISGWMKTKTTVMVKNFFQRRLDSGHNDFELIAKDAEEKKARGESPGKLPNPSVAPKRRYEATPSSISIIPRPLAPHGDNMMEIEETRFPSKGRPHGQSPQPMSVHMRPLSEKERNASRYQPLAQATAASPVPTATLIEESTRAIRAQGGPSHRVQGPRLGYFTGERRDPSSMSNATTGAQDLSMSSRHSGAMPPDNARLEPMPGQGYMSAQQQSSMFTSHSRHPSLNQTPGSPSQLPRPDLEKSSVHRDPFPQRSYYPISGQSVGISQSPRPGLSPIKDVPRPSATPGPDTTSRQVPAKRSNIMSILNDEPEEPQPRKRFASEQAPPSQATTPGINSRPVYQAAGPSRHEEITMSGMPQKSSGYAQQSQYQPPSRGYSEYPSYGPPHSGSSTSANTDWMARFDPRAQQTPPQPTAPSLPQQQQPPAGNRAPGSLASQGSYSSYAAAPSQAPVPTPNLSAPSPAPTPPPSNPSQRSAYPSVFPQSSAQPSGVSASREMAPQPASYRPGSPGSRSTMPYGTRQDPPTPAQSSASVYGVHPRQSGTPSSYSAAATPNPVQSHNYQQHVQTMVSGSHQPQSHRSTPATLSAGSSQYGHSTPPPQSQAGRSMASLASIGRSYTPPSSMHPSMGGNSMGGYTAPPPSAPGSIPSLHQRPVGPGSLGENGSTPRHHRVYSHGSAQGRVPGSLPPPSQQPR
ncbi:unnamed protein product [Penicillium salamii]|nr:unnamed protein product [Penicillium salamii]